MLKKAAFALQPLLCVFQNLKLLKVSETSLSTQSVSHLSRISTLRSKELDFERRAVSAAAASARGFCVTAMQIVDVRWP